MSSGDVKEVKTSFSWPHMGLLSITAIVTSVISGLIGWGINEYTRDRKVLEVTTRSSGNLASVPIAAANLDIILNTPNGKEPIKTLVKYDVRISNRSEQGADDLNVFLETPSSIELVETPSITTVPSELRNAIVTKTTREPSGNYRLTVNLLNPSQSITIGYFGFSRTQFLTNVAPLNAVVSKKDWMQRNVADEALSNNRFDLWAAFVGGVGTLFGLILALIGSITVAVWRDKDNEDATIEQMKETILRWEKERAEKRDAQAQKTAELIGEADGISSTTTSKSNKRRAG